MRLPRVFVTYLKQFRLISKLYGTHYSYMVNLRFKRPNFSNKVRLNSGFGRGYGNAFIGYIYIYIYTPSFRQHLYKWEKVCGLKLEITICISVVF